MLFTPEGAGGGHFKAVPERYVAFPDLRLSPAPVGLAPDPGERGLLLRELEHRTRGRVLPEPGRRDRVAAPARHVGRAAAAHAELATLLEPDVEAFLVRAERGADDGECFLVPIDACYELVGQLRMLWRGFDGGQEAHEALDDVLRPSVRARASMSDLEFEVLDARAGALRRGADDHVPAAGHRAQRACRCTRSRCAARSASSRSAGATTDDEEGRARRGVRRAAASGASR